MIGHRPFSHIPDLVNMRTVNIHDKRDVWFPKVYHGTWSKMLIRCIRHIFFRYLFDAIIFLNALFIGFDLDGGEPFFLALFTLEILLKDWLYANTPISKFASFSREKKTAWTFEKKHVSNYLLLIVLHGICNFSFIFALYPYLANTGCYSLNCHKLKPYKDFIKLKNWNYDVDHLWRENTFSYLGVKSIYPS